MSDDKRTLLRLAYDYIDDVCGFMAPGAVAGIDGAELRRLMEEAMAKESEPSKEILG